jgi:hypothetical protein
LSQMKGLKGFQARDHRRLLQSRLNEHKMLVSLSPVRSLPSEIIASIFEWSVPSFGSRPVRPRSHEAPLLLCQICSRWRKIALTTPSIWCCLVLSVGPRNASQMLDLLTTWFGRSGALPLWLSIYCDFRSDQQLVDLIDVIYSFASQIKILSFVSPPLMEPDAVRLSNPPNFPLLTNLSIRLPRWGSSALRSLDNVPIRICLQGTNALQYLTLHAIHVDVLLSIFSFSHLTRLSLTGLQDDAYTSNDCLVLLSHCSKLTHFSITRMKPDIARSPAITVPSLVLMYILVYEGKWLDLGNFFEKLTCPRLEYIKVQTQQLPKEFLMPPTWSANSFSAFVAFAGRSMHPLTVDVPDQYSTVRDERSAYLPTRCSQDQLRDRGWLENASNL